MWRIQQEQQHSHDQIVDLLQNFSKEIKKVEELRAQVGESVEPSSKKEVSGAGSMMEEEDLTTTMVLWSEDTKILKPPQCSIVLHVNCKIQVFVNIQVLFMAKTDTKVKTRS